VHFSINKSLNKKQKKNEKKQKGLVDRKKRTTNFFNEFVISKWTSCRSSKSNMAPKYPILLSVNLEEAINLRHSNCNRKNNQLPL